ncbi:MAG: hypothetical protein N2234_04230 [Planctomycetota bacterium]|nr:hypothetical protein [Planctomycetota bacterium]
MKSEMFLTIVIGLVFVTAGCCGSSDDETVVENPQPVRKAGNPPPYARIEEARNLIDEGYEIYCRTLNIADQFERDRLLNSALAKYEEAEKILTRLEAEYDVSEYPKISELHSLLVMRKKDAGFSKGITDR